MKANFQFIPLPDEQDSNDNWTPDDHLEWITSHNSNWGMIDADRLPPEGYETYHCVDVGGDTLKWMNESFTSDKFTWYVWFESVFLVPDEMLTFLALRWT